MRRPPLLRKQARRRTRPCSPRSSAPFAGSSPPHSHSRPQRSGRSPGIYEPSRRKDNAKRPQGDPRGSRPPSQARAAGPSLPSRADGLRPRRARLARPSPRNRGPCRHDPPAGARHGDLRRRELLPRQDHRARPRPRAVVSHPRRRHRGDGRDGRGSSLDRRRLDPAGAAPPLGRPPRNDGSPTGGRAQVLEARRRQRPGARDALRGPRSWRNSSRPPRRDRCCRASRRVGLRRSARRDRRR